KSWVQLSMLVSVGCRGLARPALASVGLGLEAAQDHDAVDRHGLEHDPETLAVLMRPRGADLDPVVLGFAVLLVFANGEGVEAGGRGGRGGLLAHDLVLAVFTRIAWVQRQAKA